MKSKTKIEGQTRRKTDFSLVETIRLAKKNGAWQEVAGLLSTPRRKRTNMNLDALGSVDGDVIVSGKVLSQGEAPKKKIVAFQFSARAKEKILKAGGSAVFMSDEIKKNPEMKGLILLR